MSPFVTRPLGTVLSSTIKPRRLTCLGTPTTPLFTVSANSWNETGYILGKKFLCYWYESNAQCNMYLLSEGWRSHPLLNKDVQQWL